MPKQQQQQRQSAASGEFNLEERNLLGRCVSFGYHLCLLSACLRVYEPVVVVVAVSLVSCHWPATLDSPSLCLCFSLALVANKKKEQSQCLEAEKQTNNSNGPNTLKLTTHKCNISFASSLVSRRTGEESEHKYWREFLARPRPQCEIKVKIHSQNPLLRYKTFPSAGTHTLTYSH